MRFLAFPADTTWDSQVCVWFVIGAVVVVGLYNSDLWSIISTCQCSGLPMKAVTLQFSVNNNHICVGREAILNRPDDVCIENTIWCLLNEFYSSKGVLCVGFPRSCPLGQSLTRVYCL